MAEKKEEGSSKVTPIRKNLPNKGVKLLKNHTHAGTDYKAGETIEVREDQVKWLEEAGVIEKKED